MTRRAAILAICLAAALVLLGSRSWTIALGRVEQHAIRAIENRTGFTVKSLARAEFAFLPMPRISLSDVAFAQADGAVAGKAQRVRAFMRLLPLMTGELDFDRIDFVAPQLDIAVASGGEGVTDWLAPPLTELEKLRSQSRIVIHSGSVFLRSGGAIQSVVRDVNLVIAERDRNEALSLSGSFAWRGITTDITLLWPVLGGSAKASLSAASPLMKLRFDGTRSGPEEPFVSGTLALSTPSLPALLNWFGENSRLAGALGSVGIAAELRLKPHEAAFNNAALTLDGERLDGVLKLAETDGRLALSGTLAGATLDLGRMIDRLPLPAPDGTDRTPLDLDGWTGRDVDLRVSVDAARLQGARLADVATYLLVRRGRFESGLLRASAYGGTLKSRFLAVTAPTGVDIKLQAGFDKLNLGQAGADIPGLAKLSGSGSFQLAMDGAGRSLFELAGSLTGRASLTLRQGEIGGVALLDWLRRGEKGLGSSVRDVRQVKTEFDSLAMTAGIANGLLVLTDAQMAGPQYRLGLAGNTLLRTRELNLSATVSAPAGTPKITFLIKGPVEAPYVTPESEALLNPGASTAGSPALIGR